MSAAIGALLAGLSQPGSPIADLVGPAFDDLLGGETDPVLVGALLMGLNAHTRDPLVLAAAARALRARMVPVSAPDGAIDVCGTGGDGAHSLNISTAATFVLAGAGICVAKHGNRAISSRAGAADVLEALGVRLDVGVATLEQALRACGLAFLFAPTHHPAMRHVGPARRTLGVRTIFNQLGPLANPASVSRQMVGVFAQDLVGPTAATLGLLGADRAIVVHGFGGLDEISPAGPTSLAVLDRAQVRLETVTPADYGLPVHPLAALAGADAASNARALEDLLNGQAGAYRDTVLINAAEALRLIHPEHSRQDAVARLASAIDTGKAKGALETLKTLTQAGAS